MSLVRYPGGKTRLVKKLWPFIAASIENDHYAEPFAGGGSTFLHVARQRPELKITINDKDADLANFWTVVAGREADFNRVCAAVAESREPTDDPDQRLDYWHQIRDSKPDDPALAAFRFLFLDKTCFGGQIGTSPMGGYKQNGWKGRGERGLASQYTVDTILANLHHARRVLAGRTTVTNLDVFDFLGVVGRASFYLDPPYFPKKVNRLYRKGMSPAEHQRLADLLRECPHPWVLSYDSGKAVRELYDWANMVEIQMRSSHRPKQKKWKTKIELLILPVDPDRKRLQPHHQKNTPNSPTEVSSCGVMQSKQKNTESRASTRQEKTEETSPGETVIEQPLENVAALVAADLVPVAGLSKMEEALFGHCEVSIAENAQALFQIGEALRQIRDGKLYRAEYATFEEYCRKRWNFTRAWAYGQLKAADVRANLSTVVDIENIPEPLNERQLRPLASLESEQQRNAWKRAAEIADGKPITNTHVQKAVKELFGGRGQKKADAQFDRDGAWSKLERLLLRNVKGWPADAHVDLSERFHKFITTNLHHVED